MQIHVSPDDGLPVYKQIFNQVKYLVASGVLAPRRSCRPSGCSPSSSSSTRTTVAPRPIARLEHAGLVFKRGTAGTYVSDAPLAFRAARAPARASPAHRRAAGGREHMGVDVDELKKLIDERDEVMRSEHKQKE